MAATVMGISSDDAMSRWAPDPSGRLQQAAFELYCERGFESTTVAQIAERAGLTERTFFRHFADKREVLFRGMSGLQDFLVDSVDGAPASRPPIEAIAAALDEAARVLFEERSLFARRRQAVITSHPELRERELIKLAGLAAALAEALRRRGVTDPAAGLAAEAGIAVFKIAFATWVGDPAERSLPEIIRASMHELALVIDGQTTEPDANLDI
jgi:AcrR family transcriptional regulator